LLQALITQGRGISHAFAEKITTTDAGQLRILLQQAFGLCALAFEEKSVSDTRG